MTLRDYVRLARRPLIVTGCVVAMGFLASWVLSRFGIDLTTADVPTLARELRSWGAWSVLASILLMLVHSVVPFPSELIVIANGMIFGPLLGTAITWTGAMLAAATAYAVARYWGRSREPIAQDGALWNRIRYAAGSPSTLLAVRLMPMISFNLINYALGMLGVGWWRFLWTTAVGILPVTIGLSYFGQAVLAAPIWVWLVMAGVLALMPALLPLLTYLRRGDCAR